MVLGVHLVQVGQVDRVEVVAERSILVDKQLEHIEPDMKLDKLLVALLK